MAVGQLAGHTGAAEHVAALHHLAGFAGGLTGTGGEDDLVHDGVGFGGVLLEVILQHLADGIVDGTAHLGVAELGLGLALELRLVISGFGYGQVVKLPSGSSCSLTTITLLNPDSFKILVTGFKPVP